MVRRSALNDIHLTPPDDPWLDWWMLAQLSLRGPFYFLNEQLAVWRLHDQSYNRV